VREDERSTEFDRLFAQLVRRAHAGVFEPSADVYLDEDAERLIVVVELAGAEAEDLKIGSDARHLYIVGRRADRSHARRGSILQKEIQYGEFFKKLRLPLPIDHQSATAVYRDGILTIALPLASSDIIPVNRTEIRVTVKRTFA
jgi:HSP20 family protein